MSKLMGIGKVKHGRVMFITADGKGFSRPITQKEVEDVPVVDDIRIEPWLSKALKENREKQKADVVYVNFNQEPEDDDKDEALEALDRFLSRIRNKVTNSRVFKYFFGDEEDLKGGDE